MDEWLQGLLDSTFLALYGPHVNTRSCLLYLLVVWIDIPGQWCIMYHEFFRVNYAEITIKKTVHLPFHYMCVHIVSRYIYFTPCQPRHDNPYLFIFICLVSTQKKLDMGWLVAMQCGKYADWWEARTGPNFMSG